MSNSDEAEDDLPPRISGVSISITDSPFSAEGNQALGDAVGSWAIYISKYLELGRLEGIDLAGNYRATLARVTGREGTASTPTENEHGTGMAMTVRVAGEDGPRSRVVMDLGLASHVDAQTEVGAMARYTLIHELCHVHEQDLQDRGSPVPVTEWRVANNLDRATLWAASGLLSEYSACRLSAWVSPERGEGNMDMLASALRGAAAAIDAAEREHPPGSGAGLFWEQVSETLHFLFMTIGYAFGHLHGLEGFEPGADAYGRISAMGEEIVAGPFGKLVSEAAEACRAIHDAADWSGGAETHRPLMEIAERFLAALRVGVVVHPGNLYVFRPAA